jgi:O-antigen ligase
MTSIGARLAMWKASLNFYWDQPLWGHGTGSYRWLTERLFTDPLMCAISCVHPHNQFLFFGVEYGLLGLFIYSWLFVGVAKIVLLVERRYSLILAGLLTIIAVDSFINSPLWISSERNFYTAILALTMTSFYLNRSLAAESLEL